MTQAQNKKSEPVPHEAFEDDDQFGLEPLDAYKTPSWFTQDQYEPVKPEASRREQVSQAPYFETPDAQAYDAYRKRLEQKFKEGQKLYDTPTSSEARPKQRRPTMSVRDIHGQHEQYQRERQFADNAGKTGSFPWMQTVLFGGVAICIGTAAGFGYTNFDLLKQKTAASISNVQASLANLSTPSALTPAPIATHETIIAKKPVATATLDVSDVKGTLNSMIPLMLSAQAADAKETISLKLTGLPPSAYLTAGTQSGQGNWVLKSNEIAGVKLVVPQSELSQFDMEVTAVDDSSGTLAAPVKALNVKLDKPILAEVPPPATLAGAGKSDVANLTDSVTVKPVSAAPETAVEKINLPSAIPTPASEADDLVAKGNGLLQSGDIISARQFYLRASELGSGQGSFGVARSYDPKVFAQLNVVGLKPDAQQASEWYQKAALAGVVAAQP